ncbi:MAG: DsbA family oxidoreductase [Bacteroidota bacterium]
MNKPEIKIEVVSDVVCPWCYIGKRRLEKAIDQLSDRYTVLVEFKPFELNPDMPKAGRNQKEYLAAKFGGMERYEQITQHTAGVAAKEGLDFHFERQHVSPNTFDAHRLIWLAKQEGVQPAVKEALMSAYFEKGVDLTSKENLLDVVAAAGLDRAKAKALLDSDDGTDEVREMEQLNYQRRISGVPFYIINNKYGVSGAQPTEVFVQALTEFGQEQQLQGESCDVDNKC